MVLGVVQLSGEHPETVYGVASALQTVAEALPVKPLAQAQLVTEKEAVVKSVSILLAPL